MRARYKTPEKNIYILLNKPPGIICQPGDEQGRKSIQDILPDKWKSFRLFPVGRLDLDSEGLILLTNDGDFGHRITHPDYHISKIYLVTVEPVLTADSHKKLEEGIELDGMRLKPANIMNLDTHSSKRATYKVTLHEGKKRQIRRMFDSVGSQVISLKRIQIGLMKLEDLRSGEFRELSSLELRKTRELLSMDD